METFTFIPGGIVNWCFLQQGFNVTNCFRSVGSRHLVNDTGNGVVTIYTVDKVVSQTPQLDIGDIFQTQDLTIRQSLYNDLLKLIRLLQTSFVANRILERLITPFAELNPEPPLRFVQTKLRSHRSGLNLY